MISSITFVIKVFIVTTVTLAFLQIRMGGDSLENHITGFVRTSSLMEPVHVSAEGATKLFRNSWNRLGQMISGEKSQRTFINIERSKAYVSEQAERAKQMAREQLSDVSQGEDKKSSTHDRDRSESEEI